MNKRITIHHKLLKRKSFWRERSKQCYLWVYKLRNIIIILITLIKIRNLENINKDLSHHHNHPYLNHIKMRIQRVLFNHKEIIHRRINMKTYKKSMFSRRYKVMKCNKYKVNIMKLKIIINNLKLKKVVQRNHS
jgi:hypothetical protein